MFVKNIIKHYENKFSKKIIDLMKENKEWLDQCEINVNNRIKENKEWLDQYERNVNNRIKEFKLKIDIVKDTFEDELDKEISNKTLAIQSLNNVLKFDKVVKYQTSDLLGIANDLGDLRELEPGNWEILILAKKL